MTRGAIILCGGESKRMGRDKAWLPFGNETMLQRVVRLVAEAIPPEQMICVAARNQRLPQLPHTVQVARDDKQQRGPLAGLASGLAQCSTRALHAGIESPHAFYISGCDSPLLVPAFVARMFDLLTNHQIAVPHDGHRWHPLAAVYRAGLLPIVELLLKDGQRSLVALLESCDTYRVAPDELRDIDPELNSLFACNTYNDYVAALHSRSGPAT